MSGYRVAIVGATGVVGEMLARVLHERRFPVAGLRAFATRRSSGSVIRSGNHEAVVEAIDGPHSRALFEDIDVAFFAVGDEVSAAYARTVAEGGTLVVDKSSAFRLAADVPLVVPEVNGATIGGHTLLANPNCAAIPLAMLLAPIDRSFGLAWASVSTYQSVSGAGRDAVDEFSAQLDGDDRVEALPRRIAGNVIPQIGSFGDDGYSGEERKLAAEVCKILDRTDLPISATTVRVAVSVGHSEVVAFGTVRPASRLDIAAVLSQAPGLSFRDGADYETPVEVAGTDRVAVGRLRQDRAHENAWLCWIVSDNLRKGAATNAIQIAECALEGARVPV